jgi:cellulose synthase/poly-beta-1,6-N-acetylglucosamine synthase-like glycosyltransferase
MVIATIESLARLEYTNFEVIVVDNNTKDEALWKPVEAYMATLPDNFRFYHLPQWPGFKAGALNFALRETDPRAEVIGVVDADYVVTPDWLGVLVPHFAEEQVAVVQAPQAHRDWENNFFRRMCNWEFEGFFRTGMHHRHERNALIQHGTMTLVRRQSLEAVGGWSEWCICEDTELGLRLLERGMELRYIDETFGRGLTPASYKALKSQRFRWAFGAMQILKHHLPMLLGKSPLNFGQRYHFLTGWFGWLGDALQLFFTLGSIGWTIAMLAFPKAFSLPMSIMLLPILCFLVIKAAMGPMLYRRTMRCGWSDIFGASLASLGLSHAIAKGIIMGLVKKDGVFKPTAKGKGTGGRLTIFEPVHEELLLLIALLLCAGAMLFTRGVDNLDAQLWVTMLSLQTLPYVSAVASQLIAQMPDKTPA